jgi:leader peptidase (prepilin peptidase)/N-methyltransferase
LVLCLVSAPSFIDRVLGVVGGFLAFTLIAWLSKRMRDQDRLELGDAKLVAAAGAWVGWQALPLLMLIAATAAVLWTYLWRPDPDRPVSLLPFLAFGFWLVWQFGPTMLL